MAIETVVSKLSTEALGKAVTKSQGSVQPLEQKSSFKDVMSKMDMATEFAQQLGLTEDAFSTTGDMQSLSGNGVEFKIGEESVGVGKPDASQKVVDMLGEVNKGQMQMDSLVNQILYSGKRFSNQELLCIQAHVYHFAQISELTVKVAEQGIGAVRSLLSTNIGQ